MSWLEKLAAGFPVGSPTQALSPSLMFDFDDVREAVAMVERAIADRQSETEVKMTGRALAIATDPTRSFLAEGPFASSLPAMWKSALTFPRILRGALLVAICSHVEHVLREWCVLLREEWSLPKKLGRRAPPGVSDLKHCMTYLKDVAGLAVKGFERWDEWKAIDAYKTARNCLAHHGGLARKKAEREAVATLPKLRVETFRLAVRRSRDLRRRGRLRGSAAGKRPRILRPTLDDLRAGPPREVVPRAAPAADECLRRMLSTSSSRPIARPRRRVVSQRGGSPSRSESSKSPRSKASK